MDGGVASTVAHVLTALSGYIAYPLLDKEIMRATQFVRKRWPTALASVIKYQTPDRGHQIGGEGELELNGQL
jgi:hypothetical protein